MAPLRDSRQTRNPREWCHRATVDRPGSRENIVTQSTCDNRNNMAKNENFCARQEIKRHVNQSDRADRKKQRHWQKKVTEYAVQQVHQHKRNGELHTVFPGTDGKPAYWVPIAKRATDEEASQSDRSSRDAISDTNDETEQKDTDNDGDNWDEEAEVDDDLQLDIGRGRQTTCSLISGEGDRRQELRETDGCYTDSPQASRNQRRNPSRHYDNRIPSSFPNRDRRSKNWTLANWVRSTRSAESRNQPQKGVNVRQVDESGDPYADTDIIDTRMKDLPSKSTNGATLSGVRHNIQ